MKEGKGLKILVYGSQRMCLLLGLNTNMLVAPHYQCQLCSPNEAPVQLHRKSALRHVTEDTTSTIFIYVQQCLHVFSRVLRELFLRRAYKLALNRILFISSTQLKFQEQDQQVHRSVPEVIFKLQVYIHVPWTDLILLDHLSPWFWTSVLSIPLHQLIPSV